ncbi:hypothetical protein PROFUN_16641, partial [Planoprotostelium fungivorum]
MAAPQRRSLDHPDIARGLARAEHLPTEHQKLINDLFISYHEEELQCADRCMFHTSEKSLLKIKSKRNYLVAVGLYRFVIWKNRKTNLAKMKVALNIHVFDVKSILVQADMMTVQVEGGETLFIKSLGEDSPVALFGPIIRGIRLGQSLMTGSTLYNDKRHIQINAPDPSYFLELPPIERSEAGGLMTAYISSSNYVQHAFIFPDFIEHIRYIDHNKEDFIDLRYLPGPDPRSDSYIGIHTILWALSFNTQIKTLIIKDVALQTGSIFNIHKIHYGNLFGKAQISRLFRYNTTISKLIVSHPAS